MSENHQSTELLSESELFRRLNVSARRGVSLRKQGVIQPAQSVAGGYVRLYRADRLTEFAAKIHPQSAETQE